MAHHRTVRALLIVCLLAGAARADDRAHLVKGYAGGRSVRVRVVDVDGTDVEVATARAFRAMARAASANGVSLRIESGFRTNERQAELYREWRRGAGNLAAPPGYSHHQLGRALDLELDDPTCAWLAAHAQGHGFYRTVRGEPWHWEYLGARQQARQARQARPAKPTPRPRPHPHP